MLYSHSIFLDCVLNKANWLHVTELRDIWQKLFY
jgi:hypothetical protein